MLAWNLEHLMKQKRLFIVDSKLTVRNTKKKTNGQITTLADDDVCHCQ